MINKIFSLKTNLDEISLLDNEVKIFDKIDKSILENFKIIIQKINNKKINFFTVSKDKLNDNTISLMDNKFKNFYPLDYKNIWSNYNFFKHYFEFGDYNYEPKNFIKIHLKLKRFFNFKKINSIMFFLPLYFTSYKKSNKKNLTNFILDFIPKLKLKDCTYHKKVRFNRNYGYHYEKSKKMKKKFQYVSSKLGNENSKKEYHNSIFGKVEDNWFYFFSKAHQYCQYADYINLNQNSVVINCGVEYGSELKLFNGAHTIYNIDPGSDKNLDENVKYLIKDTTTKNIFLDYALYTLNGIYTPEEQNHNTKNQIKVKNLKEIINEHKISKIDLIKSDIEGAERYMVDDLIDICLKHNTQLAISIYHTNNKKNFDEVLYDYVDIPEKIINKLEKTYNFFIKHYCYERWELIFYAIPKFM